MKNLIKELFIRLFTGSRLFHNFVQRICIVFEGGSFHSKTLRKIYSLCYNLSVGDYSYGWESSWFSGPASIGKFTSIGPGVRRYSVNHPVHELSTHPCFFNPVLKWVSVDKRERSYLEVGNDVWIGANVIILPGVRRIGDGAIIGAGSVVTKNVNDFEIVCGVPAKRIGDRFDEETKKKVISLKWWDLPCETLIKNLDKKDNLNEMIDSLSNNP